MTHIIEISQQGTPFEQPACDSIDRLLLLELCHRVNNEFAAAISAVSRAAAASSHEEVKFALETVQDRLLNYAQVHHALQMPDYGIRVDMGAYLKRLCCAICRSKLDSKGIELVLTECSLSLSSERCWRLGMIVSELITNSVRHAFGEAGGEIRVEIVSAGALVECHVTDNGSAKSEISPGRGLRIIEALADHLDGRVEHRFGPHGSATTVIFPVDIN